MNEIVHLLLMQLVAGHQVTRNYTFHFHFRVPYDIIQGVYEKTAMHIKCTYDEERAIIE